MERNEHTPQHHNVITRAEGSGRCACSPSTGNGALYPCQKIVVDARSWSWPAWMSQNVDNPILSRRYLEAFA
eukprot:3624440-Amphidinium_carterae.1